MKEWECVQVKDHRDIGKTIGEWQGNGWCLHTYQVADNLNHYLLFERGE